MTPLRPTPVLDDRVLAVQAAASYVPSQAPPQYPSQFTPQLQAQLLIPHPPNTYRLAAESSKSHHHSAAINNSFPLEPRNTSPESARPTKRDLLNTALCLTHQYSSTRSYSLGRQPLLTPAGSTNRSCSQYPPPKDDFRLSF